MVQGTAYKEGAMLSCRRLNMSKEHWDVRYSGQRVDLGVTDGTPSHL